MYRFDGSNLIVVGEPVVVGTVVVAVVVVALLGPAAKVKKKRFTFVANKTDE
jgi:hypothetical protein